MVSSPPAANEQTTFHPTDPELVDTYLRPWVKATSKASVFIHEADVYAADPAVLTRRFAPAIAANGKCVWYFYVVLGHGRGRRRARTVAEGGCWRHESTKPVYADVNGKRQIAERKSFSFVNKERGEPVRTGWLMNEFVLLADGNHDARKEAQDASRDRVLNKVYRSPRRPEPLGGEPMAAEAQAEPDEAVNAIGGAAPTSGVGTYLTFDQSDDFLNLWNPGPVLFEQSPPIQDFFPATHAEEQGHHVVSRCSTMAVDPGPPLELGRPSSTSSPLCSKQVMEATVEPSSGRALPEQPQQETPRAKKRRLFQPKIKISSARDESTAGVAQLSIAVVSAGMQTDVAKESCASEPTTQTQKTPVASAIDRRQLQPDDEDWRYWWRYADYAGRILKNMHHKIMALLSDNKRLTEENSKLTADRDRQAEELRKEKKARREEQERQKEVLAREKEGVLAATKAQYELSLGTAKADAKEAANAKVKQAAVEAGAHVLGLLQSHYPVIRPQILKEGFNCDQVEAYRLISEAEQHVEPYFSQQSSSDNDQT